MTCKATLYTCSCLPDLLQQTHCRAEDPCAPPPPPAPPLQLILAATLAPPPPRAAQLPLTQPSSQYQHRQQHHQRHSPSRACRERAWCHPTWLAGRPSSTCMSSGGMGSGTLSIGASACLHWKAWSWFLVVFSIALLTPASASSRGCKEQGTAARAALGLRTS